MDDCRDRCIDGCMKGRVNGYLGRQMNRLMGNGLFQKTKYPIILMMISHDQTCLYILVILPVKHTVRPFFHSLNFMRF